MNGKVAWWRVGAAVALLTSGTACSDQSTGLRGAAVQQEEATGSEVAAGADAASGSDVATGADAAAGIVDDAVTGAISDTAAQDGQLGTDGVAVAPNCAWRDPGDRMMGFWRMNENMMATTVAPTAADTHDPTATVHFDAGYPVIANRPSVVQGKVLLGLNFGSGSGDRYIQVPNPTNGGLDVGPGSATQTGDLAMVAWVQIPSAANVGGVRVILDKRAGSPERGYHFFLSNGFPGVRLADGTGGVNYVATTGNIQAGGWYLIGVSIDRTATGGMATFWTLPPSGPIVTSTVAVGKPGSLVNNADLRIGSRIMGTGGTFPGFLDEVALFNKPITPAFFNRIVIAGSTGICSC